MSDLTVLLVQALVCLIFVLRGIQGGRKSKMSRKYCIVMLAASSVALIMGAFLLPLLAEYMIAYFPAMSITRMVRIARATVEASDRNAANALQTGDQ